MAEAATATTSRTLGRRQPRASARTSGPVVPGPVALAVVAADAGAASSSPPITASTHDNVSLSGKIGLVGVSQQAVALLGHAQAAGDRALLAAHQGERLEEACAAVEVLADR